MSDKKHPVSELQEIMAKKRATIKYDIICTRKSNTNYFNVIVECDGRTVNSGGYSKKEAKLNGAIDMLALLKVSDSPNTSFPDSKIEYNKHSRSPSPSINYIGKLQEYAIRYNINPTYIDKVKDGPDHKPIFTYVCKLKEFEEQATGMTKKEAKANVAKKMFERISANAKLAPISDVKSNVESEKSFKKAKNMYPKVTKTGITEKTSMDTKSFNNYYRILLDEVSDKQKQLFTNELKSVVTICKECNLNSNFNPIDLLKSTFSVINVKLEELKPSVNKEIFACTLRLKLKPVISEIGFDKNLQKARINAVMQIVNTVCLLLI